MGRSKTRFCAADHDKDIVGRYPDGACKVCVKRRGHETYAAYPERSRDRHYKKLYGISLVQYNEMLDKQEYRCAMCDRQVSEFSKALHVDHNHSTGKVRGLLCVNCNSGLGLF